MNPLSQTSDASPSALLQAFNLASSLNGDGSAGNAAVFSNFLSQNGADAAALNKISVSGSLSSRVALNSASSDAPALPAPALKKLVTALKTIVHKVEAYQKNHPSAAASKKDTAKASNKAGADAASKKTASQKKQDSTDATASAASPAATTATAQPTIGDLLAQLQTLLKTIEDKLRLAAKSDSTDTAQATDAATTDASSDTGNAVTNDQSNPLNGLNDLLAFMQAIGQKLDTDPTSATTQQNASTAATAAAPLPSDLKTIIDGLRKALAANDAQGSAVSSADASSAQVSVDAAAQAATPSPFTFDAAKIAAIRQEASSNPFADDKASANANFVALNVNNPAVPGAAAGANGKDGAALDLDMGAQGRDASAAAQGNTANAGVNNAALTASGDSLKASPYSFASQLSATRATNLGPTGLPAAVEQVILQLNRNAKSGNDQMTLQLNPADLGKVNIKLTIASDGKVQGTVVADNPITLHLLHKDVGSLERALQEAGMRADPGSLQFSLGDSSDRPSAQANNFGSSGGNGGSVASSSTGEVAHISADASDVWYVTPNRVNFKV